ncbi:MAG: SusC/RagA family TonB-linked outer membrane protein [Tannerellaceae bacterium]|jgi:TonB-linked SusC/RagA family outer membrane protein|nr:SusC/RagA family TonB-linked outer membrane protein [Tannerellaceae bacterium]
MASLLSLVRGRLCLLTGRKHTCVFLLLFIFSFAAYSQTTISGKVIDELSSPVIGASVTIKGGLEGSATDLDGAFTFTSSKALPVTLVVSYIGYKKQEVVYGRTGVLQIVLQEDVNTLDEVVVSAGGIFRSRREQGYTTTKVTADELTASRPATIGAGLTGKVPGLQINALSSGVNPTYRLVLRGNRSLTGNNTALVVVDNAVVSSEVLSSLNPEDIEDIQVLTGAAGATLYGSEASNGVLLITTKKGKTFGKPEIRVAHTTNFQQINFFPQLQERFGQGTRADGQHYDPIENQQFGPPFDGSERPLGYPLENGDQQYTTYDVKEGNGRNDFWNTGVQNQTDLSVSFGTEKVTSFISAQYLTATGTTPGDKFDRISIRLNNTISPLKGLDISYTANYVENNYDITQASSSIYSQLTQISANIPVTDYKDWENNKWATHDGWYNPWYRNPYMTAATYRRDRKDVYVTGKAEAKYTITPWLYVLYRAALSTRNDETKSVEPKATLSDYSLNVQTKTNLVGRVEDSFLRRSRFNQDFLIGLSKTVSDISLNLILGASNSNNTSKTLSVYASGLVIPDLYNISNRSGQANPTEENTHYRNYGFWGDFVAGYKQYLFLHLTARNDWTSLLSKENRSYFYPSADLSFVPTDAFGALQDHPVLDFLKLRAAISKTGNVNINPYQLNPTFNSLTGYSSGTYYSMSGRLVSKSLMPEITEGWEVGTDFRLFDEAIDAQINYYYTATTGQAILASVARSSGFGDYLVNVGKVTNRGLEVTAHYTPLRTSDLTLSVGGNYTNNKNILEEMPEGMETVSINGSAYIFADKGSEVNQIIVTDYNRVPEKDANGQPQKYAGKVIVDPNTGYPSLSTQSVRAGNTTPKHRLGLDLKFRWKDFTFTTLFEYRGGYYAIAYDLGRSLDFSGASVRSAFYNRDRFVFPNSVYQDQAGEYVENTDITVADGGSGFWSMGSYNRSVYRNYVYAADYWKWREVALSYQIPKSVIGKIPGIAGASISVQARNLFLWTSKSNEYTDPDYSNTERADDNAIGVSTMGQTPPTRQFGGTISLTF